MWGLFNIRVISGSPSSETMGQVKFKSSNVLEELPRMVHLLNSPQNGTMFIYFRYIDIYTVNYLTSLHE